jgi:hypothetical protein
VSLNKYTFLFISAVILTIVNAAIFYLLLDSFDAGRLEQFDRYYTQNVLNQPEASFCEATDVWVVRLFTDCEGHKEILAALVGGLSQ